VDCLVFVVILVFLLFGVVVLLVLGFILCVSLVGSVNLFW